MKLYKKKWCSLYGEQDDGTEVEMIRTSETVCGYTRNECERLAARAKQGIGRPNKNKLGKVIRQDITKPQFNEDIFQNRKIWRLWIKVEG